MNYLDYIFKDGADSETVLTRLKEFEKECETFGIDHNGLSLFQMQKELDKRRATRTGKMLMAARQFFRGNAHHFKTREMGGLEYCPCCDNREMGKITESFEHAYWPAWVRFLLRFRRETVSVHKEDKTLVEIHTKKLFGKIYQVAERRLPITDES